MESVWRWGVGRSVGQCVWLALGAIPNSRNQLIAKVKKLKLFGPYLLIKFGSHEEYKVPMWLGGDGYVGPRSRNSMSMFVGRIEKWQMLLAAVRRLPIIASNSDFSSFLLELQCCFKPTTTAFPCPREFILFNGFCYRKISWTYLKQSIIETTRALI